MCNPPLVSRVGLPQERVNIMAWNIFFLMLHLLFGRLESFFQGPYPKHKNNSFDMSDKQEVSFQTLRVTSPAGGKPESRSRFGEGFYHDLMDPAVVRD